MMAINQSQGGGSVPSQPEQVLYPRLCVTTVPRSVISNHSHSLMILFFPTITLSLLVLPSFTPFALQERTLSLDMYLGSEIIN